MTNERGLRGVQLAMRTRLVHLCVFVAVPIMAAEQANVPLEIRRASAAITIDGDLSEPAWKQAVPVDKWYETDPGDNVEPAAKSVGYLLYDEKYFFAGFELQDPNPSQIRAPSNDRDHIGGNTDDYAGVILDTRNDGKTAILFLSNPRGIEYDAVSDDISGNEDSWPDLYWDAAARITKTGWTLEIRIPFSSLRYDRNVRQWGVMLYRNMPRDRRYQMFANRIPRGVNCFICNRNPLVGLENLPSGRLDPRGSWRRVQPRVRSGLSVERGARHADGTVSPQQLAHARPAGARRRVERSQARFSRRVHGVGRRFREQSPRPRGERRRDRDDPPDEASGARLQPRRPLADRR
jgi:hypothetical protein